MNPFSAFSDEELDIIKQELEGLEIPLAPEITADGSYSPYIDEAEVYDGEDYGTLNDDEETDVTPTKRRVLATNNSMLDKEYERLMRMTQVFSKFASMLALRHIRVDVVGNNNPYDNRDLPEAPAWSDGESITFRRDRIKNLDTTASVIGLKGLSLHEIAHILLTPRDGTVLIKKVRADKLWQAFNALEDMRIEMFMTTRYANVKDWLTATIAQYLLESPDQVQHSFPLIYGRKYLPVEVRKVVRDSYKQPQDIAELEQLIDKYIVLNLSDPANYNTAHAIIKRYNELVAGPNMHINLTECSDGECSSEHTDGWSKTVNPNGHDTRKNAEWKPTSGKALTKQQQEAILKKMQTGNGDGYGDASDDGDGKSDTTTVDGGSLTGLDKVIKVMQDTIDDVKQRRKVEINDAIKQLNGEASLNGKQIAPPARGMWTQVLPVDGEAVNASRSFATELERLRGDHDPGWNRRVESGRLNVSRYITGADVEECFDEWQLGREDAVDIEAVVLLDTSGSMDWAIKTSFQSMWAIKRALDKVNAATTVLTFSHESELLYSSNERATHSMKYTGSGGGTNPTDAIAYGYSVLANSSRAIKLFIAITDGSWPDAEVNDNKIKQLRKAGIITALGYVAEPNDSDTVITIDSHGCEIAVDITDPRDLFTLARRMVKTGIARNLAQ